MKTSLPTGSTFLLFILLCAGFLLSCEREEEFVFEEPVKSLEGQWQIVKATRNGADLMAHVDFSEFRLNFNGDSTYTIDNLLPFIVRKKGTYALDDPKYPFVISFRQEGSAAPVTTQFSYPVVNGKRQISLSFSPGCEKNIYQYTFERIVP